MSDLVERLRSRRTFARNGATWMMIAEPDRDCAEAATEIERLRATLKQSDADLFKTLEDNGKLQEFRVAFFDYRDRMAEILSVERTWGEIIERMKQVVDLGKHITQLEGTIREIHALLDQARHGTITSDFVYSRIMQARLLAEKAVIR